MAPLIALIVAAYERKHLQEQTKLGRKIRKIYETAINEAAAVAALQQLGVDGIFDLSRLLLLSQTIDRLAVKLTKDVTILIQNGINDSWILSNKKNDEIFDIRIDRSKLPYPERAKFYDTNKEALEQFLARKTRGLDLSKRIYKQGQQFKIDLEQTLGEGVANGKSATKMASEAKQYLTNPDKLFRRVRDAKGKLKLSAKAKAFNPGQGVYRSSYKNALRLTGTETNMSYRKADNERYKTAPGVIGYEVHLSNNHPKVDICDSLNLVYPVTFVYTSWHPHCRCFVTPVMCSDEEFERYIEAIGEGRGTSFKFSGQVKDMPEGFTRYVQENADRINGLKSKPYFIRDNPKQAGSLLLISNSVPVSAK